MKNLSESSISPLQVAISQIGQSEHPKGSNWGHPVQDYLASVGIMAPAAWCAAFVYWCFHQVTKSTGKPNPLFKTGSVMTQWNQRKQFAVKDPLPGDIFIMRFPGGLGHTGLVLQVEGTNIKTVEGNSNSDHSREGWEVVTNTRPISSIFGFIRI
jgi:hypothetical protein